MVMRCSGRTDYYTGFAFVFANIAVSESHHQPLFYPTKERVKRIEKYLSRLFLSKGVDYEKGRY